jgi:hypothetical protein
LSGCESNCKPTPDPTHQLTAFLGLRLERLAPADP